MSVTAGARLAGATGASGTATAGAPARGTDLDAAREEFRAFADTRIAPYADEWHRDQYMPPTVARELAARGYLGMHLDPRLGGGGQSAIALGLLAGELGRACSSARSLLTVHTMVASAVARWGSRATRARWLPELAAGRAVAALAVSEPGVGSDASAVETSMTPVDGGWRIDGHKRWITYGRSADVFLVVGRSSEGPTAVLVERDTAGVRTSPIDGLVGIRASMTADVRFDGVEVPAVNLVGRPGLGISHVAGVALDLGRYTVAWGCVGIVDACLEASIDYAEQRSTFGSPIRDHQLVRRMISDMHVGARAARLMCLDAGRLREERSPDAQAATSMAKHLAATTATRVAADAVQVHGANGCGPDYPVARLLGDARVMEIIEGSSQLHQIGIADYAFQQRALARARESGSRP